MGNYYNKQTIDNNGDDQLIEYNINNSNIKIYDVEMKMVNEGYKFIWWDGWYFDGGDIKTKQYDYEQIKQMVDKCETFIYKEKIIDEDGSVDFDAICHCSDCNRTDMYGRKYNTF